MTELGHAETVETLRRVGLGIDGGGGGGGGGIVNVKQVEGACRSCHIDKHFHGRSL